MNLKKSLAPVVFGLLGFISVSSASQSDLKLQTFQVPSSTRIFSDKDILAIDLRVPAVLLNGQKAQFCVHEAGLSQGKLKFELQFSNANGALFLFDGVSVNSGRGMGTSYVQFRISRWDSERSEFNTVKSGQVSGGVRDLLGLVSPTEALEVLGSAALSCNDNYVPSSLDQN